jgi:hypothetical protein
MRRKFLISSGTIVTEITATLNLIDSKEFLGLIFIEKAPQFCKEFLAF